MPVISEGSRSGVHCIRLNVQSNELAIDRASMVLPMPGTSSTNICPPLSKAASIISIRSSLPTNTFPILERIREVSSAINVNVSLFSNAF